MLLLMMLAQSAPGRTREVVYDPSRSIEIRPAVSDASHHVTCVVTFPEESIETLVAAWNEADLSIERKRDHLFIKLFRPVEGDLHVLGAGGTLYRLYIKAAEGEPDAQVRIVRPAEAAAKRSPAALELVRAMRLARPPETVSVRRAPNDVLFRAGSAEARARWVYESTHYTGYVVEVANGGESAVHLDPRCFAGRDLVLVGVRESVVPARSKTLLYLVFWR
jgi:type IV secretory pathway VirB9-like protein